MQLPREQLKEILERQPEMKPGLWQYVLAKNGQAKAQAYAEVSYDCFHRIPMCSGLTSNTFCSSSGLRLNRIRFPTTKVVKHLRQSLHFNSHKLIDLAYRVQIGAGCKSLGAVVFT